MRQRTSALWLLLIALVVTTPGSASGATGEPSAPVTHPVLIASGRNQPSYIPTPVR